MSTKDVERFIHDLKGDKAMQEELKKEAAGIDSVIAFAKARGYDIDRADVRAHLSELSGQELSDEEIDRMAGGQQGATSTSTTGPVFVGPSPMVYAPSQTLSTVVINSPPSTIA